MKKAYAATLESASAGSLAWALLVAELGAAFLLFSYDLVPPVLIRSLQVFLRF